LKKRTKTVFFYKTQKNQVGCFSKRVFLILDSGSNTLNAVQKFATLSASVGETILCMQKK